MNAAAFAAMGAGAMLGAILATILGFATYRALA
jgi:hypothetical protein